MTNVTNFSFFPEEILLHIIQYLYLPGLEALSMVCRRLRAVCSESLQNEQEIARNTFRDIKLDSSEYGYHDFLLRILKHEINANYVKRLDCSKACKYPPFNAEDEEIDVARYIGWTPDDTQLVRTAITRSPWMRDIELQDELIAKMLNGSEDSVMALMIPMLQNLSFFVPPARAPILMQVFVKIARLQIATETDPERRRYLPLRKLHTIYHTQVFVSAITLAETIHYVALPCVQRVYLHGGTTQIPVHERAILRTVKGKGIPRSRASAVFICDGDMLRDVAEMLVDHFEGPCVIRQYMDEHIPSEAEAQESWVGLRLMENNIIPKDPMSYYWDHCVVSGEKDPVTKRLREDSRNVLFEIKYRNFHYENDGPEFDMVQYEEDMKQVGTMPSPDWLHLAKWHHILIYPMSDIDSLVLE